MDKNARKREAESSSAFSYEKDYVELYHHFSIFLHDLISNHTDNGAPACRTDSPSTLIGNWKTLKETLKKILLFLS